MMTPGLERIPAGDGLVRLKGPCSITGVDHTTPPVAVSDLERYEAGELIQVAFPKLSPAEREFLVSGTSPDGYRQMLEGE